MFGLFSKKPGDSADGKGSGNAGASATGSRDSRSDGAKSRRASGKTLVSMLGSVGKQTSVKSILKKGAHGRVESDSDEGSDSRDEFDFGSDGGLSPAALADRRAIGSANGDSASRGSRRRVAKPPQDGPVLNGAFVGAPYAQDGRGNVSIYAQGGEFWLLASQLACYNVPEQYHQDVFLYFCPKRNPKDGTSFDPSKCVRIFVPGYSESGALPPPPAADSLEELADLRFSLSECYDEKRGENVAVDPRRYQSIVACKPGVLDINGNEQVPTVIYGYVNLVKVGSSREEQAAEMAAKLRRQSVAMAEFSQDAMQPVSLYGKTYQDMDVIAKDCFATLGKTKEDGSLTFAEFKMVLVTLNVPFTEARAYLWFDVADADGSGEIEFEEFQHLLFIVSRCNAAHWVTLRDVYYFFTNDRSQGDEEEEEVAAKFGAGTGSRAADDAASLVKTKLPPLDALGLHALLNSLGFKISLKKADKSVKLANSRMPHKTTIEYEQVKEIFVNLADPRAELARRGISVSKLMKEGTIQIADAGSLRRVLKDIITREDAAIIEDVRGAVIAAQDAQTQLRISKEAAKKERASLRERDDKAVKRHKALIDRAERMRKQREAEAANERVKQEQRLKQQLKAVVAQRATNEEDVIKASLQDTQKEEDERRVRLGLDKMDLSNRGLLYLPPLLWSTAEGRKRLSELILLDLSHNKLVKIPGLQMLYHCMSLQKLDLSNNALQEIPAEIGDAKGLLLLYLHQNEIKSLPDSIGTLSQLKRLTLHSNMLENLPDTLQGWTNLLSLSLEGNWLSSLPNSISSCVSLRELVIAGNNLQFLPDTLGECVSLVKLDARTNQLRELPDSIGKLKKLTHLIVSHNQIRAFPDSIGKCRSLRVLEAARNTLKFLPLTFGKLESLISLDLCDNSMKLLDESVFSSPGLRKLQKLDLSKNKLGFVPATLGRCVDLQTLNLSNNLLRTLPTDLAACRLLRHWDLHMNCLGIGGGPVLPTSIGTMSSLEWLDVSSNSAASIIPELAKCSRLKHLNISYNKITSLDADLASIPTLLTLDASNNCLTYIAAEFGGCTSLRALDVSCNKLVRIPDAISNCGSLRHLHLYNNRITTLPFSMAWMFPQLVSFDVGKNPLGALPHKWAGSDVFGARDVLALRFARERRDPLLIEVRRARARELMRRINNMRASHEDRLDYERMCMLKEDTRLRSKGSSAVVAELASFSSRPGWSRSKPGDEKDRLDEWLLFIRSEIQSEKRAVQRAANSASDSAMLADDPNISKAGAVPPAPKQLRLTNGSPNRSGSSPNARGRDPNAVRRDISATRATASIGGRPDSRGSSVGSRGSSRPGSRQRGSGGRGARQGLAASGLIGVGDLHLGAAAASPHHHHHDRVGGDDALLHPKTKREQQEEDEANQISEDEEDFRRELQLRRLAGHGAHSPLKRPSREELIRRYRGRSAGGNSSRPGSNAGSRPGSRGVVLSPLFDARDQSSLLSAPEQFSPEARSTRMDAREADIARARSDAATGYTQSERVRAGRGNVSPRRGAKPGVAEADGGAAGGIATAGSATSAISASQAEYYAFVLPADDEVGGEQRMDDGASGMQQFDTQASSHAPVHGVQQQHHRHVASSQDQQQSTDRSATPADALLMQNSVSSDMELAFFGSVSQHESGDEGDHHHNALGGYGQQFELRAREGGINESMLDGGTCSQFEGSQRRKRMTSRHRHMYEQRQAMIAKSSKPQKPRNRMVPPQPGDDSQEMSQQQPNSAGGSIADGDDIADFAVVVGNGRRSVGAGDGGSVTGRHDGLEQDGQSDTPQSQSRLGLDQPSSFGHVHEVQSKIRRFTKRSLIASASGRESELLEVPDGFAREGELPGYLQQQQQQSEPGALGLRGTDGARQLVTSPHGADRSVLSSKHSLPSSPRDSIGSRGFGDGDIDGALGAAPAEQWSPHGTAISPRRRDLIAANDRFAVVTARQRAALRGGFPSNTSSRSPSRGGNTRRSSPPGTSSPDGQTNSQANGRSSPYDRFALWRADRTVDEGAAAIPEWMRKEREEKAAKQRDNNHQQQRKPVEDAAERKTEDDERNNGRGLSPSIRSTDDRHRSSSPMGRGSPTMLDCGRASPRPATRSSNLSPRRSESPVEGLPATILRSIEVGPSVAAAVVTSTGDASTVVDAGLRLQQAAAEKSAAIMNTFRPVDAANTASSAGNGLMLEKGTTLGDSFGGVSVIAGVSSGIPQADRFATTTAEIVAAGGGLDGISPGASSTPGDRQLNIVAKAAHIALGLGDGGPGASNPSGRSQVLQGADRYKAELDKVKQHGAKRQTPAKDAVVAAEEAVSDAPAAASSSRSRIVGTVVKAKRPTGASKSPAKPKQATGHGSPSRSPARSGPQRQAGAGTLTEDELHPSQGSAAPAGTGQQSMLSGFAVSTAERLLREFGDSGAQPPASGRFISGRSRGRIGDVAIDNGDVDDSGTDGSDSKVLEEEDGQGDGARNQSTGIHLDLSKALQQKKMEFARVSNAAADAANHHKHAADDQQSLLRAAETQRFMQDRLADAVPDEAVSPSSSRGGNDDDEENLPPWLQPGSPFNTKAAAGPHTQVPADNDTFEEDENDLTEEQLEDRRWVAKMRARATTSLELQQVAGMTATQRRASIEQRISATPYSTDQPNRRGLTAELREHEGHVEGREGQPAPLALPAPVPAPAHAHPQQQQRARRTSIIDELAQSNPASEQAKARRASIVQDLAGDNNSKNPLQAARAQSAGRDAGAGSRKSSMRRGREIYNPDAAAGALAAAMLPPWMRLGGALPVPGDNAGTSGHAAGSRRGRRKIASRTVTRSGPPSAYTSDAEHSASNSAAAARHGSIVVDSKPDHEASRRRSSSAARKHKRATSSADATAERKQPESKTDDDGEHDGDAAASTNSCDEDNVDPREKDRSPPAAAAATASKQSGKHMKARDPGRRKLERRIMELLAAGRRVPHRMLIELHQHNLDAKAAYERGPFLHHPNHNHSRGNSRPSSARGDVGDGFIARLYHKHTAGKRVEYDHDDAYESELEEHKHSLKRLLSGDVLDFVKDTTLDVGVLDEHAAGYIMDLRVMDAAEQQEMEAAAAQGSLEAFINGYIERNKLWLDNHPGRHGVSGSGAAGGSGIYADERERTQQQHVSRVRTGRMQAAADAQFNEAPDRLVPKDDLSFLRRQLGRLNEDAAHQRTDGIGLAFEADDGSGGGVDSTAGLTGQARMKAMATGALVGGTLQSDGDGGGTGRKGFISALVAAESGGDAVAAEPAASDGEVKVVGALAGNNIKRLRAMAKQVEDKAEAILKGNRNSRSAGQETFENDVAATERAKRRLAEQARLRQQFGSDAGSNGVAGVDGGSYMTGLTARLKSLKGAAGNRSGLAGEKGADMGDLPPEALAALESITDDLPPGQLQSGLVANIRASTVSAVDTNLNPRAAQAYEALLKTGVLGKMQLEKELKAREASEAATKLNLQRASGAIGIAMMSQSLTQQQHHEQPTLANSDAVHETHVAATGNLLEDKDGGTTARLLYQPVADSDKAHADVHGSGPVEAGNALSPFGRGPHQHQLALQDGGNSESKDHEAALALQNPHDAVAMMFARAKEIANVRKAERLARVTGTGYDPRRDPANVLRTDSFEQDFTILAAPASGIRKLQPTFGDGVINGLWKGNPYARPEAVPGATTATVSAGPESGKFGAERQALGPGGSTVMVTVPLPQEITGISLDPSKKGFEPPASESIKERRMVHEKRIIEAAEQVKLFRYVGGVRFVHGDIEGAEAEARAMYGVLAPGLEQVMPAPPAAATAGMVNRSHGYGNGASGVMEHHLQHFRSSDAASDMHSTADSMASSGYGSAGPPVPAAGLNAHMVHHQTPSTLGPFGGPMVPLHQHGGGGDDRLHHQQQQPLRAHDGSTVSFAPNASQMTGYSSYAGSSTGSGRAEVGRRPSHGGFPGASGGAGHSIAPESGGIVSSIAAAASVKFARPDGSIRTVAEDEEDAEDEADRNNRGADGAGTGKQAAGHGPSHLQSQYDALATAARSTPAHTGPLPPLRPRSARDTIALANHHTHQQQTIPGVRNGPSSRPHSGGTTGTGVARMTGDSIAGSDHDGLNSLGSFEPPILHSASAVPIGGGFTALRPSSAGSTVILNADGSIAVQAPAMPAALIRVNNPFKPTPGEGNEIPATLFMPRNAQLAVLLDKGDHNAPARGDQHHMAAGFQNGYSSGDVAEYLRLESIYAGYAETEWFSRAGAYLEGRASVNDFVKAVRRRMQGKDPLTAAPEPLPPEAAATTNTATGAGKRADVWDPVLVPLIQRYFSLCYRTGLPPLYGSLTPAQQAARNKLMELVAEYRAQRHARVHKTLKEQWSDYEALYQVDAETLAQRQAAQSERSRELLRHRINSEMTDLALDVKNRAMRQHERMETLKAIKREQTLKQHGHDIGIALQKAKEKDEWEAQQAKLAGLNPQVALSKRARHMALAAKLMGGGNPPIGSPTASAAAATPAPDLSSSAVGAWTGDAQLRPASEGAGGDNIATRLAAMRSITPLTPQQLQQQQLQLHLQNGRGIPGFGSASNGPRARVPVPQRQ